MADEEKKPIRRRKATLDDIKPVILDVEIEDAEENEDGELEPIILEFKLKVPSFSRWNAIGGEVADPTPTPGGFDKQGRPIFDTNNWGYRTALNDAANERNVRRLAEAMLEPAIPGDSLPDKAQFLKENMAPGIISQLCTLLVSAAAKGGEARIASRANNFHQS